jgi:hypothetical protein
MSQPQMTVQEAAATLQIVIQKKCTMSGDEYDAARTALNMLFQNYMALDRAAGALKVAAEQAGVDVDAVLAAVQQGQQGQQAPPAAPPRAEKRRGKLEAVKPTNGAATAQE